MPATRTCVAALLVVCFASCDADTHVGFLGHQSQDFNDDTVSTKDLEASLRMSLDSVLAGGGGAAGHRLSAIEASVWRTFQAMPKNSFGRVEPRGVRHIVHSYFGKEHGWLINGLEPHGMTANVSEVHSVSILKDKAPALVETLLETRQAGHGLTLSDVVAMIGALEHLIFDESRALVQVAYKLNSCSLDEKLTETTLNEVLRSYLLIFGQGHQADVDNATKHQDMKASLSWPELDDFQYDIVNNFDYMHRHLVNPFRPRTFSFADVMQIVTEMAQTYGKWQNSECDAMKEHLMDLDADGSGRVPLDVFQTQPAGSVYQFTESREYLRQIGALDETGSGTPRVLIANYVTGPSNCIASSSYYSVCCLNQCEALLNDLEGSVQAPTAAPEKLLGLVGNLSSATVNAPRRLPLVLADKLQSIAEIHGGSVPLQGRLFAQWLHFVFPNECPYPSIVESSLALAPKQWLGGKSLASSEERLQAGDRPEARQLDEAVPFGQWSDDEVLPLHEPSVSLKSFLHDILGWLRSFLRLLALLGAAFLLLRATQAAVETANTAFSAHTTGKSKKNDDLEHLRSLYV
jgi:hypothetical protein